MSRILAAVCIGLAALSSSAKAAQKKSKIDQRYCDRVLFKDPRCETIELKFPGEAHSEVYEQFHSEFCDGIQFRHESCENQFVELPGAPSSQEQKNAVWHFCNRILFRNITCYAIDLQLAEKPESAKYKAAVEKFCKKIGQRNVLHCKPSEKFIRRQGITGAAMAGGLNMSPTAFKQNKALYEDYLKTLANKPFVPPNPEEELERLRTFLDDGYCGVSEHGIAQPCDDQAKVIDENLDKSVLRQEKMPNRILPSKKAVY